MSIASGKVRLGKVIYFVFHNLNNTLYTNRLHIDHTTDKGSENDKCKKNMHNKQEYIACVYKSFVDFLGTIETSQVME